MYNFDQVFVSIKMNFNEKCQKFQNNKLIFFLIEI